MQQEPHDDIPPLPKPWGDSGSTTDASGNSAEGGDQHSNSTTSSGELPARSRPGCGKPAALGCGCFGLGAGILLIVLAVSSTRIVTWFFDLSEQAIFQAMPEDVTESERAELATGFAGFKKALETKQLRTGGVTQLQRELTNAYARSQEKALERVDIQRLIEAFSRALPTLELEAPKDSDSKDGAKETATDDNPRGLPIASLQRKALFAGSHEDV